MTADAKNPADYLVLGAGLAGLAFAREVATAGKSVCVLEAEDVIGGRTATWEWRTGPFTARVDIGAQYFTARGKRLEALAAAGIDAGWLRVWSRGFPLWRQGRIEPRAEGHPRFAPPDGMQELARQLLAPGVNIWLGKIAVSATWSPGFRLWQVLCSDGTSFVGRALIGALPPAILSSFLNAIAGKRNPTLSLMHKPAFDPAWTLMLRLTRDLEADWTAVEFEGHAVLGWVARDHTKRPAAGPPILVVHATGTWSRAHAADTPEAAQASLIAAVQQVLGPLEIADVATRLWRYAKPTVFCPGTFSYDTSIKLGACGDWFENGAPIHGGKVEAAAQSGWKLAECCLAFYENLTPDSFL